MFASTHDFATMLATLSLTTDASHMLGMASNLPSILLDVTMLKNACQGFIKQPESMKHSPDGEWFCDPSDQEIISSHDVEDETDFWKDIETRLLLQNGDSNGQVEAQRSFGNRAHDIIQAYSNVFDAYINRLNHRIGTQRGDSVVRIVSAMAALHTVLRNEIQYHNTLPIQQAFCPGNGTCTPAPAP